MLELGTDYGLSPVLPPSARARACTVVPVTRPNRMMLRACDENLTVVHTIRGWTAVVRACDNLAVCAGNIVYSGARKR